MAARLSLPLFATIKSALQDVFGDLPALLRAISVMLLASIVFVEIPTMMMTDYIYSYIHPDGDAKKEAGAEKSEKPAAAEAPAKEELPGMQEAARIEPQHMAVLMGLNLLQMAILIRFLVGWYRQLLLGDGKGTFIFPRFGKEEWSLAKTMVKVSLVLFPVMMVLLSYALALMPQFSDGNPENIAQVWPVFVVCGVLLLYFFASVSMSNPLTIMGRAEAPIKDSWRMTQPHVLNIAIGTALLFVSMMLVSTIIISGISLLLHLPYQSVPGAVEADAAHDPFFITLALKVFGIAFTLVIFATLSAFYARVYAFLVRSQQDKPEEDKEG